MTRCATRQRARRSDSLPAGEARTVLDCSCGIGTQAIGLSRRGYEVTGTDISERSLRRATQTARTPDAPLRTQIADFRDLSDVAREFDVAISCDNAIPHLVDDAQIDLAVSQMFGKLRPSGLLVISIRDYDRALRQRPTTAPPVEITGPPRRIVARLHEWDAPDSLLYTVRFLILTQEEVGWRITDHATRYRALPAAQLTGSAARAGLIDVGWLTATEAGFHQPVMVAQRPR
jgi:glycine/sarcosine N-methyltransferase